MADPLVSTRLDRRLAREVDVLARRRGQRRSALLRDLIERGLAAARLEDAVAAYRDGHISFGRGAELAGVSVWEFHEALRLRRIGVPRAYTREDMLEDVAQAFGEA